MGVLRYFVRPLIAVRVPSGVLLGSTRAAVCWISANGWRLSWSGAERLIFESAILDFVYHDGSSNPEIQKGKVSEN